jgi:hypothetical protein
MLAGINDLCYQWVLFTNWQSLQPDSSYGASLHYEEFNHAYDLPLLDGITLVILLLACEILGAVF